MHTSHGGAARPCHTKAVVPAPVAGTHCPGHSMIRRRLTLTATPDKRACASAIRGPWPRLAPDPPIDPGSRSLRSLGRADNLSEAALVWGAGRPGLVLSGDRKSPRLNSRPY